MDRFPFLPFLEYLILCYKFLLLGPYARQTNGVFLRRRIRN